MAPAAPFHALGEHFAIDLPGARAVFTTRRGGFSRGPYASLNLGLLTDDDPARVRRNRTELDASLGVRACSTRQVHETHIHRLTAPLEGDPPQADGQLTTVPRLAPLVLAADCLPVLLAAPGAVAALHCGWRGLAGGIVERGAEALRAVADPGPMAAAIGPGAGGCCYEVGPELHAAFAGLGPDVRRGRNLDLKAVARLALERAGATEIHDIGMCTLCGDPELFFSHRRDRGLTGRQAGLVWLS